MFHMPLREIRERFTFSEIAILSWRSQEQVYKLKAGRSTKKTASDSASAGSGKRYGDDVQVPEDLPPNFYNKEGDIDLSKVTGDEAYRYFQAQGIQLPIIPRSKR